MRKTILYIAGRGNSGSTLLDIVLSQLLDFRSCGELLSGVSRLETQLCTCKQLMKDCSEWKVSNFKGSSERRKLFEGINYRGQLSRLPEALWKLESHWNSLEVENEFLQELCSDHPGLVDSSKEISRSIFLSRGPAKAHIVHLIRNPVALMVSARRQVAALGVIKINRRVYNWPNQLNFVLDIWVCVSWVVSTGLLYLLNRNNRDLYCIVDYDNFTTNPIESAELIAEKLKLDGSSQIKSRGTDNLYHVGHLVGGNRMAASGTVSVNNRKDESESHFLSRVVFWVFAGIPYWLMKRSKYNLNNQSILPQAKGSTHK